MHVAAFGFVDTLRLIIDYGQDVTAPDDCQAQSLVHADRCRAIEAPVRVVVPETAVPHSIRAIHVDQADGFRSMDFDFALQMYL